MISFAFTYLLIGNFYTIFWVVPNQVDRLHLHEVPREKYVAGTFMWPWMLFKQLEKKF